MVRTIQNTQQKHVYIKKRERKKNETPQTLEIFSIETLNFFFLNIIATLNSKQGHSVIDAKHPKPVNCFRPEAANSCEKPADVDMHICGIYR